MNKLFRRSRGIIHPGFALLTSSTLYYSQQSSLFSNGSASLCNPLLEHSKIPKFSEIKVQDVEPAISKSISFLKEDFIKIQSRLEFGSPTYSDVVEDLERARAPLSYSWGIVGHLMSVHDSDELRKVHDAMQPSVIQINQELGQSQILFSALTNIKNSSTWDTLDEAQKRIVDSSLKDMKNSGIGLSEEKRAVFNKLKLETSELSTKFSNNVLDSTKSYKLVLTKPEEIEGLPASAKGLAAQQAIKQGHLDATAENGPWLITLDLPMYLPCMQHLKNRNIREILYRAYISRASSGETDNSPIITGILQRKLELARMLV